MGNTTRDILSPWKSDKIPTSRWLFNAYTIANNLGPPSISTWVPPRLGVPKVPGRRVDDVCCNPITNLAIAPIHPASGVKVEYVYDQPLSLAMLLARVSPGSSPFLLLLGLRRSYRGWSSRLVFLPRANTEIQLSVQARPSVARASKLDQRDAYCLRTELARTVVTMACKIGRLDTANGDHRCRVRFPDTLCIKTSRFASCQW